MHTIQEQMNAAVQKAFASCGFADEGLRVQASNRPDLCEYQCNGAMAAAKRAGMKPIDIADRVAELLKSEELFSEVSAVTSARVSSSCTRSARRRTFLCRSSISSSRSSRRPFRSRMRIPRSRR